MVAWQGLESAVFDIFRYFFAHDHWDAAATVFFTVQSFENRMQLIDALMIQFADKEKNKKWADLHKRIRKKSKNRNTAAHANFVFFGKHPKRKAVIGRSIYDITKFPDFPILQDFTTAKELEDWSVIFIRLSKEVNDFLGTLQNDTALALKLRARPQKVEESDRKYLLVYHTPRAP